EEEFVGLLSIGDLQRAIIDNLPLQTPIRSILRREITISSNKESFSEIKQKMLLSRTECMPVLDENGGLVNVYFWEDLFDVNFNKYEQKLDIPVVIMAGGQGSRLKPLTKIIPKPLVPIGDKPIIEVIINKFNSLGVNDFYLSVNYKHEMIKSYF